MQSRNYNNFQTRIRSIAARRRTQQTGREDKGIRKNIEQDTINECRDSKDNIQPRKSETTQRPNTARDFY